MNSAAKRFETSGRVRLTGRLRLCFESHEFIPDGANERWWCTLDPPVEQDILARYGKPSTVIFGVLNRDNAVEVEGALSGKGRFGHMSLWRREIRVRELRVIQLPD